VVRLDHIKTIMTIMSVVSRFAGAMDGVVRGCRGRRDNSGDELWGAHTGY
jgi:hypothetical protein